MSYYAEPHRNNPLFETADIILGGGYSKFHSAKLFFEAYEAGLKYDALIFVDGDLELLFDPGEFFSFCLDQNFAIAQASLTEDSYYSFHITRHNPSLLYRTTNYVETMAPLFSKRLLREVWPFFDKSISTWGLDILWSVMLPTGWTAAIVDQFQMRHAKPVDIINGPFYRYIRSLGIDCQAEVRSIMNELGIREYEIKSDQFVYLTDKIPYPAELEGELAAVVALRG